MATIYDRNIDPAPLSECRVAVLGYGAQGRAHALNLRDSGVDVVVGLRARSARASRCRADGLAVAELAAACAGADIVVLLTPDEVQPQVYSDAIAPHLHAGGMLMFAHGFNLHYKRIEPRHDLDVVMLAPLGIGDQVRERYVAGGGVPALLGLHSDRSGDARAIALAYARANGHGRAGVIETTIRDETETDLFAEQAVLCGGLTHLVTAGFDTLVEAGYPAELAYFSCLHEVKLLADLMYRRGIAGMRESISSTAEFGDYTRGPRIINAATRAAMREILAEIRDGRFAAELAAEFAAGAPTLHAGRATARAHRIEAVGERLRAMMPWLERDGAPP